MLYSSSCLCTCYRKGGANSETFETCIFGCTDVRTMELATQVLWHVKFFRKFDSFACAFQVKVFDVLLTILKSFTLL